MRQHFLAALGASLALLQGLKCGVPAAQMGQQIWVNLPLVGTRRTFQIALVLPEFIGQPIDVEFAPHARYCK